MENQFTTELTNQEISENGHSLAKNKSVDVFNALSLYNEELGIKYEQEGYNPFEDGFVLTEDYAKDILENKSKDLNSILPENFLDYGNKEVSKHFENSLSNSEKVIEALQNELIVSNDENLKKQIKKCLVFMKNRNELLKMNIAKLKQKDINALKMYLEMYGMDSELSELMKDSFNEEANMQIVISQMLGVAHRRSINLKQKSSKFIREIKNAQMQQASEQVQQTAQTQVAQQQVQKKEEKQEKEQQPKVKPQEQKQEVENQPQEQPQDETNKDFEL